MMGQSLLSAWKIAKNTLSQIGKFLDKNFARWTVLKSLKNAGMAKYLPFVSLGIPVFSAAAPAILKQGKFEILSTNGYFCVYFSSVLYVLGRTLFDHICPEIIKNNNDQFSYFKNWSEHFDRLSDYKIKSEKRIHELVQAAIGESDRQSNDLALVDRISTLYDDIGQEICDSDQVKNLDRLWENANKRLVFGRVVISSCFFLSLAMAFFVIFLDIPANIRSNLLSASASHSLGPSSRNKP